MALERLRAALPPQRRAALLLLAAAAGLVHVRCTASRPSAAAPDVEVLLERDAAEVRLGLDGAYRIEDEDGALLGSGERLVGARIRARPDGIDVNGVALDAGTVRFRPAGADLFELGGRRYAGDLRVRRDAAGRLEVANVLDIEEYLAGVLFSEMPASFPDEALRAQTVAARSYARWRLSHGDELLRATDADQVYGGATSLHRRARSLVASTRGVVLEIDGRPLPAYFMSTCGGATVDAPLVFAGSPRRGLTGVECEWCRESPKFRWSRSIARPELERRLGLPRGSLTGIATRRDSFGHALAFAVEAGGGARTFEGQEFRRKWNAGATADAERLPSAWLRSLDLSRTELAVEGAGFGHGVGMCQYGAAGLARAGRDWRQIVRFYYRGADLVTRW